MSQISPEFLPLSPQEQGGVREVFEEQECTEFWYAKLAASSHEDDAQRIEAEIDALLTTIDIPPADWVDYWTLRSGDSNPSPHLSIEYHRAQLRANPRSLGRYLLDCAYDELPIEYLPDGECDVLVRLTTNDNNIDFSVYGQHWTDYIFPNVPKNDTRTAEQLLVEADVESDLEYEITISLTT